MEWSKLEGNPPIRRAEPEKGTAYFIVKGEDSWAACISTGIRYKFVQTLNGQCEGENEALRICEQHYEFSKPEKN